MAKNKTRRKTKKPPKELTIRRHIPLGEKAILANHILVRSGQGTTQLVFFEIEEPFVLDTDSDEIKKEASKRTHVDAHCVSRVAVPTGVVPSLIQALQSNLVKQQSAFEAMEIEIQVVEKKKNTKRARS